MNEITIIAIILSSIIVLVLIIWISIKNGLIAKQNQVENAFSLIDVMLKQRFDLIPQLISIAKGYMEHEKTLLEKLTELRSQPRDTESLAKLNHQFKEQFQQFNIVAEAYPDLKANEQFLLLQRNISEMEEQLAASRRTYNVSIQEYNDAVMQFPSSIVANSNKMYKKDYLVFND